MPEPAPAPTPAPAPAIAVGSRAPDFELVSRARPRETVRLSQALGDGPVVLITYLFDFSPG